MSSPHPDGFSAGPRICVVGSANYDQVTRAPRLPKPGETVHGTHYETGFGGKGANQAVMAARLGGSVTMVAKLGGDAIGKITLEHFQEEGIDTRFILIDTESISGVAPIWVDETTGQNQIIAVPGANGRLTPSDVEQAEGIILGADVVVCQNEIPEPCNLRAFEIASQGRATTIYNIAPARECDPKLLQLTDVLVANQFEAALLTRHETSTDEGIEATAWKLREKGPETVLITLGERGLFLLEEEKPHWIETRPVKAVDTTGAGDAFVGTFAFLVAEGHSAREASKAACRTASLSVLRAGAQTSFPSRDEVGPFLL